MFFFLIGLLLTFPTQLFSQSVSLSLDNIDCNGEVIKESEFNSIREILNEDTTILGIENPDESSITIEGGAEIELKPNFGGESLILATGGTFVGSGTIIYSKTAGCSDTNTIVYNPGTDIKWIAPTLEGPETIIAATINGGQVSSRTVNFNITGFKSQTAIFYAVIFILAFCWAGITGYAYKVFYQKSLIKDDRFEFLEKRRSWALTSKQVRWGCGQRLRMDFIEKISLFIQVWQQSGAAFVPAVYWDRRPGTAQGGLAKIMTGWFDPLGIFTSGPPVSFFYIKFWGVLIVFLIPLAIVAVKERAGRGFNSNGLLNGLGEIVFNTLALSVMSQLLRPWACDDSGHIQYYKNTIQCWTPSHTALIFISFLSLPIYFAGAIYANMALKADREIMNSDWPFFKGYQYQARYMIVKVAMKFLVAGFVGAFGWQASGAPYVLVALFISNSVLLWVNVKWQPCTLDSLTFLNIHFLFSAFWSNIMGVVVAISSDESIRTAMSWVWLFGIVGILVFAIFRFKKKHREMAARRMAVKTKSIG